MLDNRLQNVRLMSKNEVLAKVRISSATMYRRIERGEFPKQIKLGRNSYWIESEIVAFLESLMDNRNCHRSRARENHLVHRTRATNKMPLVSAVARLRKEAA